MNPDTIPFTIIGDLFQTEATTLATFTRNTLSRLEVAKQALQQCIQDFRDVEPFVRVEEEPHGFHIYIDKDNLKKGFHSDLEQEVRKLMIDKYLCTKSMEELVHKLNVYRYIMGETPCEVDILSPNPGVNFCV